jgi:hypothetical protein
MSLTFAGVPLLLPDRFGRLERFMAEYQCLDELRAFSAEATWQAADRKDGRSGFTAKVNLSAPNWPTPPAPKLNTLYWPSGASRWAWGLFLATKTQRDAVLAAVGAASGGIDLTASASSLILRDDENGVEVTAEGMHLLPPRPISVPGVSTVDESLWLLPIVDDRYFWQWLDMGAIAAVDALDQTSTWADLWGLIETGLTKAVTKDTISADYFKPDPREFTREFQNIGMLMDAAAASVGHRIVRKLDGSILSIGAETAAAALAINTAAGGLAGSFRLIAGGDFSDVAPWSICPEKVAVVCPRYDLGRPDCDGAVYATEVTATSLGVSSYRTALVKVFFSTAFADYLGDVTAATPDNTADLTTLATQIATDYYAWIAKQFDYTFAGLKSWTPTGFEDWIEWTWGRLSPCEGQDDAREATERAMDALVGKSEGNDELRELRELLSDLVGGGAKPRREYLATTRVQSFPPNFGVDDLLQQFELPVHEEWLTVELDATLTAGGSVVCSIFEHDGANWVDTTVNVTAYEDTRTMTGNAADRAYLHWHCQSKRWQIAQKSC